MRAVSSASNDSSRSPPFSILNTGASGKVVMWRGLPVSTSKRSAAAGGEATSASSDFRVKAWSTAFPGRNTRRMNCHAPSGGRSNLNSMTSPHGALRDSTLPESRFFRRSSASPPPAPSATSRTALGPRNGFGPGKLAYSMNTALCRPSTRSAPFVQNAFAGCFQGSENMSRPSRNSTTRSRHTTSAAPAQAERRQQGNRTTEQQDDRATGRIIFPHLNISMVPPLPGTTSSSVLPSSESARYDLMPSRSGRRSALVELSPATLM